MTKNIGLADRVIRFILGTALLGGAVLFQSPLLALAGLFTLYEAAASWCVLYQLLGRNTCPLNASHTQKIPFLKYYLTGLAILITAIILNLVATYLGWLTWYDLLSARNNFSQVSMDNWVFLLIFYPLSLAIAGMTSK